MGRKRKKKKENRQLPLPGLIREISSDPRPSAEVLTDLPQQNTSAPGSGFKLPPGPGRGKKKNSNADVLQRWNEPGATGFYNWICDIQPCILTRSNRYEIFTPTPKQQQVIEEILSVDENNNFVNSMSLLIWPRRHGKSTIFALIVLWLITSRQNLVIQLLGNTEDHSSLQRIPRHPAERSIKKVDC